MRKRVFVGMAVMLLLVLAFVAGGYAESRSYQFTGLVKTVDSSSFTVQKTAKETWQFELGKETKGATPKIGDRVIVHYRMVATEIEANTPSKKKP